uniref:Carboxylic ester hydrolase n=1 Tax=Plectus sambesii TaxID=2011161 RepID=A0A914WY70_9BILA
MLDQQIALRWINQNVKAFGGDPAKVTLFGESAGAASIVAHLIAPASQGLFANGILQSGSLDNKWSMDTPEHAYDKSMQMAALVGCNLSTSVSENIDCLRKAPVEKFTEQLWNIKLNFLEFPLVTVSRDNGFFSKEDAFSALRAGRLNKDVNIMIGINHDEGYFWLIYNIPNYFGSQDQPQLTREQYRECIDQAFASHSLVVREAAANVYADQACEQGSPSNFYAEQINQMIGDYFFTCDSIWLSDLFAQNDYPGNVFIYYFDQPSSANPWPKWTGVMHAYEIEFAFGVPLYNTTANYTSNERSLSRKMVQYWSSFAKTGRPAISNPSKSEIWPQYTKDNRKWLYLKGGKDEIKAIDHRKETECKMWRSARDIEYQLFVQAASQYRPTTLLLLPLVLCFAVYLRN